MVTADQAMAVLSSHQRIWVQCTSATPNHLLAAFARRAADLTDMELIHFHLEGPTPWVAPHLAERVRDVSLFVGPNLREAVNDGRASYVPLFLSDAPWFLTQKEHRPDVVFITTSPPDRHGFVTLAPSVEATQAAISRAEIVIAQVNPRVPRTHGDTSLHADRITFGVAWDGPLHTLEPSPPTPETMAIGRQTADLVPERSTIQVGIGRVPDAILAALASHRDLGVHSEMLSDGIRLLAEAGVITGAYKAIDQGRIVGTFALGTKALYDFIDDNPMVALRTVDYTNDPAVIRKNPCMISINSAVEVDLTGQVAAESIGSRLLSGVGGQMDFVRGASLSEGGRSIIALPSRTAAGVPRIVASLRPGAAVTTTRNHVQFVVTEYGVAELHGASLVERARRLAAIAHPDDREHLTKAAHALSKGA